MTKQEAIAVLQQRIDFIEDDQAYNMLTKSMYEDGYRRIEAFKMAIAALNEVGSAATQTDAQHAKKLTSNALAGTDYADRLRWLLSQAERVVTVDAEDRQAVDRACKLIKEIDNGFDRERGIR